MATKRSENGNPNPKSKVTVMMFQMEGTDETLLEGIRTIGNAIGHVLKPLPRLAKPANALSSGGSEVADTDNDNGNGHGPTDAPAEVEEDQTPDTPSQSAPSRPRSPVVLDDLKIGSVTIPALKDFLVQKKAEGDSDNYLVMTYWLKHHLNVPEVTMDHIHTCYRFLEMQTPADASSPLRNGKRSGIYSKGKGKGAYVINHVGENRVMGMK